MLNSHDGNFIALKIAGLSHGCLYLTFSRHILWLNYQVALSHGLSESYIRQHNSELPMNGEVKTSSSDEEKLSAPPQTMISIVIAAHLMCTPPPPVPPHPPIPLSEPGGIWGAQLNSLSGDDAKRMHLVCHILELTCFPKQFENKTMNLNRYLRLSQIYLF